MARIRTIKPELPHDRKLAGVSRDARLTFIYTLTIADDDGLFRAEPRELLGALFPLDQDVTDSTLERWFAELIAIGVLRWRRTRDGSRVGEVVNWSRHQVVKNRSKPYLANEIVPLGDQASGGSTETVPRASGDAAARSLESRVLSLESTENPPVVPPGGGTALAKRKGRHLEEVKAHLAEVFGSVNDQTAARMDRERFRRAGAEFVFAYWAKKLHHPNALFDEKREARIGRALQENYDNLSELCYVVDGVLLDPWEGRRQQDDILVIMRDRTHIEKLADLCPGYRAGRPHPVLAHLGANEFPAEAEPAEVVGVGA